MTHLPPQLENGSASTDPMSCREELDALLSELHPEHIPRALLGAYGSSTVGRWTLGRKMRNRVNPRD